MYIALHHFAKTHFVQGKESLLQNCHRMYIMVPQYMYMTYFFTNFTCKTKESQGSCTNRLQLFFLYVYIKMTLFLSVMNSCTRFVNPCALFLCFRPKILPILNVFAHCYLCIFAVPWIYNYITSLNKSQLHFSSFQCLLFRHTDLHSTQ